MYFSNLLFLSSIPWSIKIVSVLDYSSKVIIVLFLTIYTVYCAFFHTLHTSFTCSNALMLQLKYVRYITTFYTFWDFISENKLAWHVIFEIQKSCIVNVHLKYHLSIDFFFSQTWLIHYFWLMWRAKTGWMWRVCKKKKKKCHHVCKPIGNIPVLGSTEKYGCPWMML